ncbi:hypothetical protein JB92DRAFT_3102786 [Gautieria morchelliformis]|nr:hypothetical protein JB92DRAFT_3102786 [Gautieria morchelliformis]
MGGLTRVLYLLATWRVSAVPWGPKLKEKLHRDSVVRESAPGISIRCWKQHASMIPETRQANFVASKSLRRGGAPGPGTGANVLSGGRGQDTVYHPLQKQQYSILVDAMTEDQPWTTRRLRPHRYTKKRGAFTENADTRRTQTHGERTAVTATWSSFFQLFLTAIWSRTYVINSFVAVPRQAPGTRILRESPPRVASRVPSGTRQEEKTLSSGSYTLFPPFWTTGPCNIAFVHANKHL